MSKRDHRLHYMDMQPQSVQKPKARHGWLVNSCLVVAALIIMRVFDIHPTHVLIVLAIVVLIQNLRK